MKQLLLIRHAKSSWDDINQKDFDRPLNERGNKDAPAMARRLVERNIKIEAFISSPANRAISTAVYFANAYKQDASKIILVKDLYLAVPDVFDETVFDIDNLFNTVAIFSHNPAITAFANTLTQTQIDDMPTCSVFAVSAPVQSWKDFDLAKKDFLFFDFPKKNV